MKVDFDAAYRAVQTRDPRFDGQFFTAVKTTRIYCRPACPARTPLPHNVNFYPTAAAAQAAGFRPCRRCLPDAAPGSPEWNLRADTVGAAMRLIGDGLVDREGIPGLAARLGYTPRHLGRMLQAEVGASPLALARARRAQLARTLLTTTAMPIGDIAFAAGFASIRQFNDTMREVFGLDPTALRAHARVDPVPPGPGALTLKLQVRAPFSGTSWLAFLARRAIPGVEVVDGRTYARTLTLPHGAAAVRLAIPTDQDPKPAVKATLRLQDLSDLAPAVDRCRRLLDADADPERIDTQLSADPALATSVARHPGLRVPGAVDGPEILFRALFGQQVSVAAARTALGRLAARAGAPLPADLGFDDLPLTALFPTTDALAALSPAEIPGPMRRATTIIATAAALAGGDLQVGSGRRAADLSADLVARPGIGPWTADYVVMRVLGDPDVLLTGDLALRRGATALGLPGDETSLTEHAGIWRPFRSYAGQHLWLASASTIGDIP